MSRKQRDYYEVLGVPPTASGQEINSAYRSLAVKFHPDTAHGQPSGAQQFKDITEAYDVLSDPDKRRHYDRLRQLTKKPSMAHPPGPAPCSRSGDLSSQGGWSDLLRHFFDDAPFPEMARQHQSPSHTQAKTIRRHLPVTADEARTGATVSINFTTRAPCPLCSGSGWIGTGTCDACLGKGTVANCESLPIVLPRDVRDGSVLHFHHTTATDRYDIELQIRIQPYW